MIKKVRSNFFIHHDDKGSTLFFSFFTFSFSFFFFFFGSSVSSHFLRCFATKPQSYSCLSQEWASCLLGVILSMCLFDCEWRFLCVPLLPLALGMVIFSKGYLIQDVPCFARTERKATHTLITDAEVKWEILTCQGSEVRNMIIIYYLFISWQAGQGGGHRTLLYGHAILLRHSFSGMVSINVQEWQKVKRDKDFPSSPWGLFIKYAPVNIIGLHVGKAKSVTLLMTVAFLYYLFTFDEKETQKWVNKTPINM